MNCKYCHLNTHYIDECPTIICKNCKKVGHPQWLCGQSKVNKKNTVKANDNKFLLLNDEIIKKKSNDNINYKTIASYLKLVNTQWGNLID
jgi:hypothetical protein